MFQSAGVNVNVDRSIVPSAALLLESVNVTSAAGRLVRWTANVAVAPASSVASPATGAMLTPTTSLSVFVPVTSAGSRVS